jgi:hypothetical protein
MGNGTYLGEYAGQDGTAAAQASTLAAPTFPADVD